MKRVFGVILLVGIIFLVHIFIRQNLQVIPIGGSDQSTATEVSRGEKVAINALIQNCDDLSEMFAFWDDDTKSKIKLDNMKIIARGQIATPEKLGIHKLTIRFGWIKKYTYYYNVVDKTLPE